VEVGRWVTVRPTWETGMLRLAVVLKSLQSGVWKCNAAQGAETEEEELEGVAFEYIVIELYVARR
jgi:hypothetical protein